jgi:RimJ/RimL family protein N-acetyltransferase
MEKCGMQYEGTLRGFFLCRDGSFADGRLCAILKEEFSANPKFSIDPP